MALAIRKATKGKGKLRIGMIAPTGGGKTWTSLLMAEELVRDTGLRIGVIDSERESSELYADRFDFDVIALTDSHDPKLYVMALEQFAAAGGYGCVIVDSLSHAWMGKDGALQQVDDAAKRSRTGNSYVAWRDVTPLHNELVDALLRQPYHVIATLRAKMEYVQEKNERTGRTEIKKVGLAPVQRDGMEYEFTVVCDMDVEHNLFVGKTRCSLVDGKVFHKPDAKFARILRDWIESGADKQAAPSSRAALEEAQEEQRAAEAAREARAREEHEAAQAASVEVSEQALTDLFTLAASRVLTDAQKDWINKRLDEPMTVEQHAKITAQIAALPPREVTTSAEGA